MNSIKILGKYLDQPLLIKKFENKVPLLLSSGAIAYGIHDTLKQKPEKREKTAVKNTLVLSSTVASALMAPKITAKLMKKPFVNITLKDIKVLNSKMVDEFLTNSKVSDTAKNILNIAKTKVLRLKDVKNLSVEMENQKNGMEFFNKLIPEPENITSKEIFTEIKRLSLLGLVPVVGGIAGGITGDSITEKDWKKRIPNKVKEGTYQYLANIFLCNVGAGAALGVMEKAKIQSKSARALGMIAGIVATGVVGGSAIANKIGDKVITPLFNKNKKTQNEDKRKPEALDICLHTDDIATVAVMSGLKWIEPALPLMYSISGYRAGIGYRNDNENHKHHFQHNNRNSFSSKKFYC